MTLKKAKEKKKMKTRSNMPLFVVECDNVKTLSNAQIDLLRCGDYLVKKDASGEHAYKVTFKSDTGMCITYHDASVIETQSYDKVDGIWTYNGEDKTKNLLDVPTQDEVEDTIKDLVEGGTMNNAKPIYCHPVYVCITKTANRILTFTCLIFNNDSTAFTKASFYEWLSQFFTNYPSASIMASGYMNLLPASRIKYYASNIALETINSGATNNDYWSITLGDMTDETTVFNDGVNKIN